MLTSTVVLLEHLPLSARRQKACNLQPDTIPRLRNFVAQFATACTSILASQDWLQTLPDGGIAFDLPDLIDGNLFVSVTSIDSAILSEQAHIARFDDLANVLSAVCDGSHLNWPKHEESQKATKYPSDENSQRYVHASSVEW